MTKASIRREVFINIGCLTLGFNYADGSVIVHEIIRYWHLKSPSGLGRR